MHRPHHTSSASSSSIVIPGLSYIPCQLLMTFREFAQERGTLTRARFNACMLQLIPPASPAKPSHEGLLRMHRANLFAMLDHNADGNNNEEKMKTCIPCMRVCCFLFRSFVLME